MEQTTYKTVDLFGNETIKFTNRKRETKKTIFDDYDGFVDKFDAKLTTDDCYTPAPVYKAVLDYVGNTVDLSCMEIIRPFYPGGDFENIDYPANAIVIDNPPFSIISKIARYYIKHNVKFFLFAPHLTLFGSDLDCTAVVAACGIVYENGASVITSFLSNIYGDVRAMTAPELYDAVEAVNESKKANLPKYEYPNNVATVSKLAYLAKNGVHYELAKKHCRHIRELESQKVHKKGLFGSGFLISDMAADELQHAEKKIVQKPHYNGEGKITWTISPKERAIIDQLGQ